MIAKFEKMKLRQENYEEGQEIKDMLENQKESETMLLHLKETLNDHKDIILTDIFKAKQCIEIIFRLTSECRILERIFCRSITVILLRSTGKVGDH